MQTVELRKLLNSNFDNEVFNKIYANKELAIKRYLKGLDKFEELYGKGELNIFSTPGRSEIAGNHTDHQRGVVMAAAIDLDTIAFVRKNDENVVRLRSDGYVIKEINLEDLEIKKEEEGTSESLIRGMAKAFVNNGYTIGGFDAYMTSEVLSGSGLSSSAAFEVMLGKILSSLYNEDKVSAVDIAKYAQYSENVYFGKPCGLMDQMACSVGDFVFIDFLDKESPIVKKIDFDFERVGHKLCIVDTKGDHADLTDDYSAITEEMFAVAKFFGKSGLSDVCEKEFYSSITELRKVVSERAIIRAIHLFNENSRVKAQVKNLENNDFESFKKLILESGYSSYMYLQNIYSSKHPTEQKISLGLALAQHVLNGEGAYRVHGGGFAGTIQAIVPNEKVVEFKKTLEEVFGEGACYELNIRRGSTKVL